METIYTKISDNIIGVTEVKPQEIIPEKILPAKEYDYSFLLKQKDDIQKQWDEQIAQKQREIDEINISRAEELDFVQKLIAQCVKLNITVKVEPTPEVEPIEEIIK